jgi:hypothetical protein
MQEKGRVIAMCLKKRFGKLAIAGMGVMAFLLKSSGRPTGSVSLWRVS